MKNVYLILIFASLVMGCAATKQAVSDYQLGNNTPLVNGEVSPQAQAQVIGNTVSSLPVPFAGPIGVAVTFIAGLWFTWQRGASIRKNGGAPAATASTSSLTTNGIIQDIASIASGMFTTASTTAPTIVGSVWQRVWKTALATIAAGVATASTIPSVGTFMTGHPVVDGIFVAVSSLVAGAEKALSNVPVTKTA
jgi:hypothetical protein